MIPHTLLALSQNARQALSSLAKKTPLRNPVFTIARGKIAGGSVTWGVAAYARDNLKDATIVNIDGFDFYIDPSVEDDLKGKVLDYRNGRFSLVSEAPKN